MAATDNAPLKVITVLGTRPEAIKLLPVVRQLAADDRFDSRLVLTGQHREMVDQVLRPFGEGPMAVRADLDLDIMSPGQTLNEIVARTIPRLDTLYEEEAPDAVVVQGDTTSAFAAGLAAFHRGIRVAHVEAGLRSYDRFHPFPEESNRRMLSAIVDAHLAPTTGAAQALEREGIPTGDIVVTGNTAIDSLLLAASEPELLDRALAEDPAVPDLPADRAVVLITLHRREAWSPGADGRSPLDGVLEAIAAVAAARPDVLFVYPVHLNPRVREPVRRVLGERENVLLLEPLSYLPFVGFMARATCILTDSGGVQEEAPSLGVPVLVARETTERPEGLRPGMNRLIGTERERVEAELRGEIEPASVQRPERPCPNPYGDGRAAERVAGALLHACGRGSRPEEFRYEAPDVIRSR